MTFNTENTKTNEQALSDFLNKTTGPKKERFTCYCGCGEVVTKTYRPGHDARHVSILAARWAEIYKVDGQEVANTEEAQAITTLPTLALQMKYQRAIGNAQGKIDAKAEREANRATRRAEAKAAKLAATKGAGSEDRARDEYEATRTPNITKFVADEQAAHAEATAPQIQADGGEIKIGRWTYPTGSFPGIDTQYRNTKRDGSGEWVLVDLGAPGQITD